MDFEDHPFWDFSLAIYGAKGVSTACIALQDRHGIDVNVLLLCTWIGASGRGRLVSAELDRAVEAVGAWNREVVAGLRSVRRWMREARTGVADDLANALRRQIVAIEVQCEHAEQLALVHAVARQQPGTKPAAALLDDAVANCRLYLDRFRAVRDSADREDVAIILAAALPSASRTDILRKLEQAPGTSGEA